MKVKALQLGYYDNERRREGDVFEIASETEFSPTWMERVEEKKKAGRQSKAAVIEDDESGEEI